MNNALSMMQEAEEEEEEITQKEKYRRLLAESKVIQDQNADVLIETTQSVAHSLPIENKNEIMVIGSDDESILKATARRKRTNKERSVRQGPEKSRTKSLNKRKKVLKSPYPMPSDYSSMEDVTAAVDSIHVERYSGEGKKESTQYADRSSSSSSNFSQTAQILNNSDNVFISEEDYLELCTEAGNNLMNTSDASSAPAARPSSSSSAVKSTRHSLSNVTLADLWAGDEHDFYVNMHPNKKKRSAWQHMRWKQQKHVNSAGVNVYEMEGVKIVIKSNSSHANVCTNVRCNEHSVDTVHNNDDEEKCETNACKSSEAQAYANETTKLRLRAYSATSSVCMENSSKHNNANGNDRIGAMKNTEEEEEEDIIIFTARTLYHAYADASLEREEDNDEDISLHDGNIKSTMGHAVQDASISSTLEKKLKRFRSSTTAIRNTDSSDSYDTIDDEGNNDQQEDSSIAIRDHDVTQRDDYKSQLMTTSTIEESEINFSFIGYSSDVHSSGNGDNHHGEGKELLLLACFASNAHGAKVEDGGEKDGEKLRELYNLSNNIGREEYTDSMDYIADCKDPAIAYDDSKNINDYIDDSVGIEKDEESIVDDVEGEEDLLFSKMELQEEEEHSINISHPSPLHSENFYVDSNAADEGMKIRKIMNKEQYAEEMVEDETTSESWPSPDFSTRVDQGQEISNSCEGLEKDLCSDTIYEMVHDEWVEEQHCRPSQISSPSYLAHSAAAPFNPMKPKKRKCGSYGLIKSSTSSSSGNVYQNKTKYMRIDLDIFSAIPSGAAWSIEQIKGLQITNRDLEMVSGMSDAAFLYLISHSLLASNQIIFNESLDQNCGEAAISFSRQLYLVVGCTMETEVKPGEQSRRFISVLEIPLAEHKAEYSSSCLASSELLYTGKVDNAIFSDKECQSIINYLSSDRGKEHRAFFTPAFIAQRKEDLIGFRKAIEFAPEFT